MNILDIKVKFDGKEHDMHFNLILDNEDIKNLDHEQIKGIIRETLLEQMTISWSEKKVPVFA